jgi:hypothetical protein
MTVRTLERRMTTGSSWRPLGRVYGQQAGGASGGRTPTTHAAVVEEARRAAFARTVNARLQTIGVTAPGPERVLYPSTEAQLRARNLAQLMFAWENPNMGQIADILSTMITHLSPSIRWEANAQDQTCSRRKFAAYVVGNRPPVHLCPAFFRSSREQQVRTLVHEAAHLAGIGEVEGESYCVVFDCQGRCGSGFEAADSWSHYVHCLSNQRPVQGEVITAPRRPPMRPSTRSR